MTLLGVMMVMDYHGVFFGSLDQLVTIIQKWSILQSVDAPPLVLVGFVYAILNNIHA